MSEIIRVPTAEDIIGGQFVLRREIGRGGYGVVYEAVQLGIDRKVAVKMLLPRALEMQAKVIERFQREARLASNLKHPCAVTIYAFGVHQGASNEVELPFLAMELLDGESLQEHMNRLGPLPPEQVAFILEQVLGSLSEAHRKGIIHRDMKPDNIFLHQPPGEELHVKVLDYGIAMAYSEDWGEDARERLTKTGMVTGTAEYIAPEMISGERTLTPAVDVYSMGCVAFHMLTGQFPYDGANPVEIAIKHIYEPVPELPEALSQTFLGQVIYQCMSKAPQDRYQDAAHLLKALRTGELMPTPDAFTQSNDRVDRQIVVPRSTGSSVAIAPVHEASRIASGQMGAADTRVNAIADTVELADPEARRARGVPAWALWGGAVALLLLIGAVIAGTLPNEEPSPAVSAPIRVRPAAPSPAAAPAAAAAAAPAEGSPIEAAPAGVEAPDEAPAPVAGGATASPPAAVTAPPPAERDRRDKRGDSEPSPSAEEASMRAPEEAPPEEPAVAPAVVEEAPPAEAPREAPPKKEEPPVEAPPAEAPVEAPKEAPKEAPPKKEEPEVPHGF
jgi:serine/threonine protein kinase